MTKISINAFKIKCKLPDNIYKVKINKIFKNKQEFYKFCYKNCIVPFDDERQIGYTFFKLNDNDIKVEKDEKLEDLPIEIQEQVVQMFIKITYKKELEKLEKVIYNLRKKEIPKKLEEKLKQKGYKLYNKGILKWDVIKINETFYFILDFKHTFVSTKTILEKILERIKENYNLSNLSNEELQSLLFKEIESYVKNKGKVVVKNITGKTFEITLEEGDIFYDKDRLEKWIKYHTEEYEDERIRKNAENIIKKIDIIDTNIIYLQPLIRGKPYSTYYLSTDKYELVPCFIKEIFSIEELDDDTKKIIEKYWKLSPEERQKIIVEAVKLANISFIEKELLQTECNDIPSPDIIVRKPTESSLLEDIIKERETIYLFRWLLNIHKRKESKKINYEIFLPYEIPDFISKIEEIPSFIIIDEDAYTIIKDPNKVRNYIQKFLQELIKKRYNIIRQILKKYNVNIPLINYKKEFWFEGKLTLNSVGKIINKITNKMKEINADFGIAFIFGIKKKEDYYDELKRLLFDNNIISQHILINKLVDKVEKLNSEKKNTETIAYIHTILLNLFKKLGIKYFTLKLESDLQYDYILGVDVGPSKIKGSYIGGVTIIFDGNGIIKKIKAIEVPTSGETIKLWERITNDILSAIGEDIKNKNILIIRDGKIYKQEIEGWKKAVQTLKCNITIINVVKRHKIRIFTNKAAIWIKIGKRALLLPHKTFKGTIIPIRIDHKILITNNGKVQELEITENDIKLLFDLTRLNYSTLFKKEGYFCLKTPAPIHYADKFVKALRKGWRLKDKRFEDVGALWFI